jgi:hypothetical protein
MFELEKDLILNSDPLYDCYPKCGTEVSLCRTKPRIINGREVSVQYYVCKKRRKSRLLKLNWVIS